MELLDPAAVEADQGDLDELCRDRPLPAVEVFEPNEYYGHAQILKAWAGLPSRYALKVGLPHGPMYSWPLFYGPRELVPALGVTSEEERRRCREAGIGGRLWTMALPYAYLQRLLPDAGAERAGTIFFPSHSTTGHTVELDFEALAERLAALPAERQPVTVCVYFRDQQLGHHRPFAERGMRVVSAGHPYDPQFLVRFLHLCRRHRFASSNDIGSHLFYAMASGCHWFPVEAPATWRLDSTDEVLPDPVFPEVRELVASLAGRAQPEQARAAAVVLGESHLLDPPALRRSLLGAELLDKAGIVEVDAREHVMLRPPPWTRRLARRAARSLTGRRSYPGSG